MKQLAKIKKKEFHKAVRGELLTMQEFAEKVDTSAAYLSRLYSASNTKCCCTIPFTRRILKAFNGKYVFDDLFFWAT